MLCGSMKNLMIGKAFPVEMEQLQSEPILDGNRREERSVQSVRK